MAVLVHARLSIVLHTCSIAVKQAHGTLQMPQQGLSSAGLMPVSLLSWSPNGEYVLEGGLDGSFRVWETHKWTDALWTSQVSCRPCSLRISRLQDEAVPTDTTQGLS